MLKGGGGHNKFGGSFKTGARSFSHTDGGGGVQNVSTFYKGGHEQFYPVSRVGTKSFGPGIFPFCSNPPPSP